MHPGSISGTSILPNTEAKNEHPNSSIFGILLIGAGLLLVTISGRGSWQKWGRVQEVEYWRAGFRAS